MSNNLRLVSSAKNLRSQFKGINNGSSSSASIYTAGSSISHNAPPTQSRSIQKKTPMDEPDLSMEMTLLVVKRCVKEIRERGLTTKGILRQVQMGQSKKVIMDTINMILDDDASTELSALHQIDIHLVAQAMKSAIRYSEQTLVTYADYESLYIEQDRNFIRFVHDLPATNRAILLDLFSLCADVTLLAHLNNMTLVAVAKAISLSIMAEPEREFTTFDASLQQRNMWGAACEDLLRAFLRIKTSYDLAKIEQEDEVDENRYVDNLTRVVKSARQRSSDNGSMPNLQTLPISLPSSAGSSVPGSGGYSRAQSGYFDHVPSPRPTSPLSYQVNNGAYGPSLARSQSLGQSNPTVSRPMSPTTPQYEEEIQEYEEMMQDRTHLIRLRQPSRPNSGSLRPMDMQKRRSSVADMESLYMLPADATSCADGYDSEPDMMHHDDEGEGDNDVGIEEMKDLIPDFSDGLGWDFSKEVDLTDKPSLASFEFRTGSQPSQHLNSLNKTGVIRSNSSSSNGSGMGPNGPMYSGSPRSVRDLSKQNLASARLRPSQEQRSLSSLPSTLQRAQSQQDMMNQYRYSTFGSSPVHSSASKSPMGHSMALGRSPSRRSPAHSPQYTRRNPALRRSISLDPHTMNGRINKKATELRTDILARELAVETERALVEEDIRTRLLEVRDAEQHQEPARASSEFSLQSSPHDLERPVATSRAAIRESNLSISTRPRSPVPDTHLEIHLSDVAFNHLSPLSTRSPALPNLIDDGSGTRAFEVISRPKDIEVSHLSPVSPVSPRGEMRSKFQENFPERPISPPPGYINGRNPSLKRSPAGNSTRSMSSSNITSSPASAASPPRPPKHVARALSPTRGQRSMSPTRDLQDFKPRPLLIPQGVSSAGPSTPSTPSSAVESKPKGVNFIRALSHKLRPKQSEDQLRPVRINNQVVNAASAPKSAPASAPVPTIAPLVTIELPRLELDFLGGLMGPSNDTKNAENAEDNDHLPLASAPASMMLSGPPSPGGSSAMDSWRREAQALLPVADLPSPTTPTSTKSAHSGSALSALAAGSGSPTIIRPRGFTGGRRASATAYVGPSTITLRDQQQRRKIKKLLGASAASSPVTSPLSSPVAKKNGTIEKSQKRNSRIGAPPAKVPYSDSSYTTGSGPTFEDMPGKNQQEEYLPITGATLLQALASNSDKVAAAQPPVVASSPISPPSHVGGKSGDEKKEFRFSTATLLKDGKLYYQVQWDEFSELGFKSEFFTEPEQYLSGIQQQQKRMSKAGSRMNESPSPMGDKASSPPHNVEGASPSSSLDPSRMSSHLGQVQGQVPRQGQDSGPSPEQRAAAFKAAQESFKALAKDPKALAALKAGAASNNGQATVVSIRSISTSAMSPRKNNPYPSPEPSPGNSVKSSISSVGSESLLQRSSIQSSSTVSDQSSLAASSVSQGGYSRGRTPHGSAVSGGVDSGVSHLSSSAGALKDLDKPKKNRLFGKKFKSSKKNQGSNAGAAPAATRKRRMLPMGVKRQDVMTKTEESLDEVFPWMLIEHMAGQESGWVMLEPVEDGAVGWVKIDRLEEEVTRLRTAEDAHEQRKQHEEDVAGAGSLRRASAEEFVQQQQQIAV
ncbi:hypothetical protein BGZ93_010117 [Podila epicladia]|nr:hypothetical protein BGZ92_009505 [Podila epicladia]KAG0098862.1 hypothetical protein BGZ93_010117 [Podila epicladia]